MNNNAAQVVKIRVSDVQALPVIGYNTDGATTCDGPRWWEAASKGSESMNTSKMKEIRGLVTSIALAVVVAVAGILVLGDSNSAAESAASDTFTIETQTPDEAGTSYTKKGVERFQVTDVQAMPSSRNR